MWVPISTFSRLLDNSVAPPPPAMTTIFTELPIVDLAPLSTGAPTEEDLRALATQLHDVFATVGFAYLVNAPLSWKERAVFDIAREFFSMSPEEKMKLAKKTFRKDHPNTYRG
jgi:isopenicillin N synthase-like dioxygenase